MCDRWKRLVAISTLGVLLTISTGLAQPAQSPESTREPATPREAWTRVANDVLALSAAEQEKVVAAIEAARAQGTKQLSATVEQIRAALSQTACRAATLGEHAGG